MTKVTTEVKVGAFVIAGILILAYMTFAVGKFTFGKEKGYRFHLLLTSAAGLDSKAPVKIAGVEVGKIESITLEENRAKVSVRIFPEVRLREGTQAAIRSTGLLGDKYIELVPGKGEGYLSQGGVIGEAEAPADIDKLITQFTYVAGDIREISRSLREMLGSPENQNSVRAILTNLREMSERMNRMIRTNQELIDQTIANFKELSGNLNEMVADNKRPINETLANLESFSRSLKEDGPRLVDSLNSIAEKIEKGEGTLGKLVTDKSVYEKLDSTLEGVNKFVTSMDQFNINVGFRGEYQIDEADTKGYFSLRLQPREDKYYLFELIDDPRGKTRVTETVTTTTPGGTVATREIKTSDQLKFSAEFARRFGNVVVRGGLMESKFGVGADLLQFQDKWKGTFEAWNLDGEEGRPNPHLKATASYTFFKNLFVEGGYDDFINSKSANAFVGGGLYFDDEDLKYIFQRFPIPMQ
ncbi:MAG: MCE family protein [Nitrospirae bacterium]|nr:MCE family protein [Nitrospirota bacterium]